MNKTQEALNLALEALDVIDRADNDRDFLIFDECRQLCGAIKAIRSALAEQPAQPQEPKVLMQEIARLHDRIKDLERDVEFLSRPAQQEPVLQEIANRYVAEDEASESSINKLMTLGRKMSDAILASPAPRKPWVGLTPQDFNGMDMSDAFEAGAYWADAKLREKNA